MAARGGRREGAGRPKGAIGKATADIKQAAQAYTSDALEVLAQIMKAGESESARVAAANAILDRGYGKPKQALDVDANIRSIGEALDGLDA